MFIKRTHHEEEDTPKSKSGKYRLHGVKVSEVSIVDRAAVGKDGHNFMLFKNAGGRSGSTPDLDLIVRIQKGIDKLRNENYELFNEWLRSPDDFLYDFSEATEQDEFAGSMTIVSKNSIASNMVGGGYGPGETPTHRYETQPDGSGAWVPKKKKHDKRHHDTGRFIPR